MPYKQQYDITKTGPQTYKDLQAQNDSQLLNKKARKAWLKEMKNTARGLEFLNGKNSNLLDDDTFASRSLEDTFQDDMFYDAFHSLPNFMELIQLSRGQRIAFYNKYQGNPNIYKAKELHKGETGIADTETMIPFATPYNVPGLQTTPYTERENQLNKYAEDFTNNLEDDAPLYTEKEFQALWSKLDKESKEIYPNYFSNQNEPDPYIDENTGKTYTYESAKKAGLNPGKLKRNPKFSEYKKNLSKGERLEQAFKFDGIDDNNYTGTPDITSQKALQGAYDKSIKQARFEYIRDNLKVPQKNNPYSEVNYEIFVNNLDKLSTVFNKFAGSRWLDLSESDLSNLYNKYKKDLEAGKLYKVEAGLDKDFGEMIEEKQPGWFKSGGDELVHSRSRVFFENFAAGAVENLMDAALVPAGLIYGLGSAIVKDGSFRDNFINEYSYLPNLAHEVAHNITGDNATAYGNSLSSALANSGYTIGTMAVDALLMAAPTGVGKLRVAAATDEAVKGLRMANLNKFNKIYGTAMSLNFGLAEGTIDALDVRQEILDNAEKQAATLPAGQRQAYMDNAIREANTAFARTALEESLVVNAGTLLGLGFLGSIAPVKAINIPSPKWHKLGKIGSFVGKTAENIVRTSFGELLEEYSQGLSSGINKRRAEYNIENYAEALHYGLGSEYLSMMHLGMLQGLERFAPQAWVEMDPENLTKQVLMSTLLFRGLKIPGFGGKSRAQIKIDNNTAIGKLWDNIRKYSFVQTGIGQAIADAKRDSFDIENSLQRGFTQMVNDPTIIDLMQDQAALTDIGIQMQKALNSQDITAYQKYVAAYQIAQGIMLANMDRYHTKFSKNYVQVLQNRANYANLSQEEQQKVFDTWLNELQISNIKKLTPQEQVQAMINTAQQSLMFYEQAKAIMERLDKDSNLDDQDVRPLVFAELMHQNAPQVAKDNWQNVSNIVNGFDFDSLGSEESLKQTGIDKGLFDALVNGYFKQNDEAKRDSLLGNLISDGYKKADINKAFNFIKTSIQAVEPNIDSYLKADRALTGWRQNIALQWSKIYNKVRNGETVFDEAGFLDRMAKRIDSFFNSPKRNKKRFIKDLTKSKNVSDIYRIYNTALNDDDVNFDIHEAILEIFDAEFKNKMNVVRQIMRTQNSIKAAIAGAGFSDNLIEKLFSQVDDIASNSNNVDNLFDISNYNFAGVNPAEIDTEAGKLQDALNNAKGIRDNAQTVDTSNPTPKQENPKTTNLTDEDINTTPHANDSPITKLTIEEAKNEAEEISNILSGESYNSAEISARIDNLIKRCPDGYSVIRGGTQVILHKLAPAETVVNEQDDADLDDLGFADEEHVTDAEVISEQDDLDLDNPEDYTPTDSSITTYPDSDVRSITKVAVGKFQEYGNPYTFAIRDEDVNSTTRAEASYTDKQGNVHTSTTGSLEVISLEEFEKRRQENPGLYNKSLEELAAYPRPKFVDISTNQEVEQIKPAAAQETESAKETRKTNRSESQQERLDNNITPARNEISPQFLPRNKEDYTAKENDRKYERLGDPNYSSIDQQLEQEGAFEYRDQGRVEVGDKIVFVVSMETMPDGESVPVIWEVTKPKGKTVPETSKFKGMQVLSVLDQTDMSGDRKALIERIRKAYDEAGRPESFLYDAEEFEVDTIIDGLIPINITTPQEASSDSVIETNNLKKSFTKKDGWFGRPFWNSKKGKVSHVPVILRQVTRQPNGTTEVVSTHDVHEVEVIKTERASQTPTKEVMLVVPTPTGYRAVHSVYILKRYIDGAIDKYKKAINEGSIGKYLVSKVMERMSNPKAKTNFTSLMTFNQNTSEYIKFLPDYGRLELGIVNNGDRNILMFASKRGDRYVETTEDARVVISDNNGRGYTEEEIIKEYLNRLIDNEDTEVSLNINVKAIKDDYSILTALIDDGMLWTPNSVSNRVGIENVGFSAKINKENQTKPTPTQKMGKIQKEPAQKPISAPMEKPLTPESNAPQMPKEQPKTSPSDVGVYSRKVKRRKLSVNDTNTTEVRPESANVESVQRQQSGNSINTEDSTEQTFNNLSNENKQHILEKGFTEETWNSLTKQEKENVLNC